MTDSFGFNGNGEDEEKNGEDEERYVNRIEPIKEDLAAADNDPEEMMMIIMEALNDTVTPIPEVGKYYTFIYNAKTPDITYDQHPLIACTDLQSWGFKGLNFHWRQSRNYTWEELAGQLYIVDYNELDDLLNFPYGKFILNK